MTAAEARVVAVRGKSVSDGGVGGGGNGSGGVGCCSNDCVPAAFNKTHAAGARGTGSGGGGGGYGRGGGGGDDDNCRGTTASCAAETVETKIR